MRRRFPYSWLVGAVAVWLVPHIGVFAAEQKPDLPTKTAEAPAPAPAEIPLSDIAARATEVANLLNKLTAASVSVADIDRIAKSLPDISEKLDAQIESTAITLDGAPSLETLQSLQQQWQSRQNELTAWLNTLTQQATKLQDGLTQLAGLQKIWITTRASAQAASLPEHILQQIDETLSAIAAAQTKLEGERAVVLELQSRVAQAATKSGTALAQIRQYQQKAVAGLFVPDAPPIWVAEPWAEGIALLPSHLTKVAVVQWSEILNYMREPHRGAALHAGLFMALAVFFAAARRKINQWNTSGVALAPALSVFERPYAAALTTVLVLATSPFFQMPSVVRLLLMIVALVPMIRLAQPVASPAVSSMIYFLCLLFAIDVLRQTIAGIQVIGQALLLVESFAAILALLWLRRNYREIVAASTESSRLILLRLVKFILTVALVVALLAAVGGYVRLARLLTPGILVGGVLLLAAFATLRVGFGIVVLALRVWPLRLLNMVERHRELVERRIYGLLVWMTIAGWLARYLAYLGLLDPTWGFLQSLLDAKMERGTIAVSAANILEFFLAVGLAYLLSRFLRFVLQEDVYPRIHLAPGLSYAASSLLNYIILALGFLVGMALLGVDFTKVSILAGAFGVGIGFGLQSVVNNFVSGIILLFERPIHVGDVVEAGNLRGRVLRIGIRASVIRTPQGAEIIVPNAQLIAEQVTNWTLSDQLRRIDIPVGVSYGTAPKRMIELLLDVARAHPKVLKDPSPQAVFLSYGDSSINFELRAWAEFAVWVQVQSDLTAAVYDALYAAGIPIPFPQRDVHIVSDNDSRPSMAPASSSSSAEEKT